MKLDFHKLPAAWKPLLILVPLFLTYIILLPHSGHGGDTYCWVEWAKYIFLNGLSNVYKSWTDYLPLFHYALKVFGYIQGSPESIERNIYTLKILVLLFDFVAGFFLIRLVNEKFKDVQRSVLYSMFFFFNIAYFYNTIIWGQVDGIVACFLMISFYYAYKQSVLLSLVFVLLALNMKLQAIVFIPIIGLMLLPLVVSRFSVKNLLIWLLIPLAIQSLILLPFALAGDLSGVWNVVIGSLGKYPVVSMNAYNMWELLLTGSMMEIKDATLFLGISYKSWGLLAFLCLSFIALLPLLVQVYKSIIKGQPFNPSLEKLLIAASLVFLLFFYVNTQMHERYSHPALIFLAAYAIISGRIWPYLLASIAYFQNMEDVLHYLQLHKYGTFIFNNEFIASLYLLAIMLLFLDLYEIRFPLIKQLKVNEN